MLLVTFNWELVPSAMTVPLPAPNTVARKRSVLFTWLPKFASSVAAPLTVRSSPTVRWSGLPDVPSDSVEPPLIVTSCPPLAELTGSVRAPPLLANVTSPAETVSAWIASGLALKVTVYVLARLRVAVSELPGVVLSPQLAPVPQMPLGGLTPLPSHTSAAACANTGSKHPTSAQQPRSRE